jgi:hypothetical protein
MQSDRAHQRTAGDTVTLLVEQEAIRAQVRQFCTQNIHPVEAV